jgi:serine/threonine protein kinase
MGKSLPSAEDFGRKQRAATGLTFRGRAVTFGRGGRPKAPRRASSFDEGNRAAPNGNKQDEGEMVADKTYPPERLPWPLPPDAGSGTKARRMSLSLPDDFTIDVAELLSEFEYHQKILGRHGKHLGKGAASKVTLMARKGCPNELYAVKEFRGKSNRESQEEYENKIKSEYSIAKSLHHPNIVETVRLCTDHSRWNHVMEYCSEGDLFSLVQKGWLKGEAKLKDRLCLFKQLVQGVAYLHANGIAHRDIKLENLLLTKDSKLKITDFGVSEVFTGTHPGLREAGGQCGQNMGDVRLCSPGICGSEPYIAPEVLAKKGSYDPRALDVWGSAIIMIYLTFGGAIWSRAEAGNAHYDKLVRGWEKWNASHPDSDATITETDYPKCYALDVGVNPPALRRILLQMLNPDPAKRIDIADVICNRWMKNVECCQLESYEEQATTIDATKKECCTNGSNKRIFCHSHLPPKSMGSHSLGKMPGQAGY